VRHSYSYALTGFDVTSLVVQLRFDVSFRGTWNQGLRPQRSRMTLCKKKFKTLIFLSRDTKKFERSPSYRSRFWVFCWPVTSPIFCHRRFNRLRRQPNVIKISRDKPRYSFFRRRDKNIVKTLASSFDSAMGGNTKMRYAKAVWYVSFVKLEMKIFNLNFSTMDMNVKNWQKEHRVITRRPLSNFGLDKNCECDNAALQS
jgi:hypothetical protein